LQLRRKEKRRKGKEKKNRSRQLQPKQRESWRKQNRQLSVRLQQRWLLWLLSMRLSEKPSNRNNRPRKRRSGLLVKNRELHNKQRSSR
jgi:hypothetical protein